VRGLPARLLVVTDRHQAPKPLPDLVEELLDAGVRWIWLRDKDLPPEERRALAFDLAGKIARHGGLLTVGADLALAEECGAGVQLGAKSDIAAARRRLGTKALIGVSAHSPAEVADARAAGADYATVSPIFASSSKPGYGPELGLNGLRAAAASGLPVLALGGITAATAQGCLEAGASALAVMGPLMREGRGAATALRHALS
jgi:thiamine-phosphate pyrophosphorylase